MTAQNSDAVAGRLVVLQALFKCASRTQLPGQVIDSWS